MPKVHFFLFYMETASGHFPNRLAFGINIFTDKTMLTGFAATKTGRYSKLPDTPSLAVC